MNRRAHTPKIFAEFIGHKRIVNSILVLISDGKLPPTIMIDGGLGLGKTTLAGLVARALNCEHIREHGDICPKCANGPVLLANQSLHLGYELISCPEERILSQGRVERLKRLTEYGGLFARSVTVFDEIDAWSDRDTQKLHRILDELHPLNTVIFTTHDPSNVSPQLASRCFQISLRPLSLKGIRTVIVRYSMKAKIKLSPKQVEGIAHESCGIIREAIRLVEQASAGVRF